jgi:hypothetical protein
MTNPQTYEETLQKLAKSVSPVQQNQLRSALPSGPEYYSLIAKAYFRNPFLSLTDDETAHLSKILQPPALGALVTAREAAARSPAPKYSVCCMPKSGSSFTQSALQHALELPYLSLTSFGDVTLSSRFGMNSREQEIDEMALVRAALAAPRGFVSQNHTRYSSYLGMQFKKFNVLPIVTIRNIIDCIVSFDEMILEWRGNSNKQTWFFDAQFAIPLDYPTLPDETRYSILSGSMGIWLLNFYISWKRGAENNIIQPLILKYEEDIIDPGRFVDALSHAIGMSAKQRERLEQYAKAPDKEKSRFKVGKRGRGVEKVPEKAIALIYDHARAFSELSEQECAYLVAPR